MGFYFFTDLNALSVQSEQNSYGYVNVNSTNDEFNLHSKFSIEENASVFSITKSLVFYQENSNDSNLLNVILFPLETNYTAGFPVKFFIYRGVSRASLLESNNLIKEPDSTWKEGNILEIIKKNQEEINSKTGSVEVATETSLGLQFQGNDSETLLESILFDFTDSFHPLIVPRGCEIGKFAGGSNLISIEVVLDKIGEDINLGYLRKVKSTITVENSPINTILSEKEQKKQVFKRRYLKEKILGFMDITAFYGACFNQGYGVEGVNINEEKFLTTFYNSNVVYIDIRDERGFSYNHFLNSQDTLAVGFYNDLGEVEYEQVNYYSDWPILKINNKSFQNEKSEFFIKLPITIGMPETANILTSYTKKVSLKNDKLYKKYRILAQQKITGEISLKESEPIKFENWSSSAKLSANYFLLKIDRIGNSDKSNSPHKIWDAFFSLDMKNVFDTNAIPEGEFRLKTYASINAPININKDLSGYYSPTIGIVADKYQVSFFSFYDELVYEESQKNKTIRSSFIQTGKYNNAYDTTNLLYQGGQAVGFLYQIVTNKIRNFELSQFSLIDVDNNINGAKFLLPQSTAVNNYEEFMQHFDCITLTHEEYNALIAKVSETIGNADFIQEHPYFIKGKQTRNYNYEQFNFIETTITLGVPKVVITTDNNSSILIEEHPTSAIVNDEEIVLTSATVN
ncbi:hypothetical protein [Tenacibaculum larymnensis]|uniref:Uncharacterized protein n=1 Tax=Tenacibaculum larymnensis TaxID=2878201 RepID=A0A9X4INA6_9FLAO|nr:hypothetical protein [Tenacibaculum larymnensis]MDE1205555.1 hypothetical protein [Tenacibaculum larymnensis]